MRLFVGVELDDAVRAVAAEAAAALRAGFARSGLRVDARWIPAENFHITLWFIGEADDSLAERIREVLAPAMSVAPFELAIAGAGAFPPTGPPRVFWFGVPRGADRLGELYDQLATRFAPLGLQPERRAYSPHLTVARVKAVAPGSARAVREALASRRVDCGACRVPAITLFRSRTSPKGATYEPLLRVPLS